MSQSVSLDAPTNASGKAGKPVTKGELAEKTISRRNFIHGIGFIAPNFIGFIILTLIPVLALFYIANTKWSAFGDPVFNGLTNWKRLLHDSVFKDAFVNTIVYAVVHIPLTVAIAFGLAILLNSKLKGRAFFRTVAFFPYITSIVAVAQVWNMLFDAKSGVINQFLGLFTSHTPGWLGSTHWAMVAVIIVATWREAVCRRSLPSCMRRRALTVRMRGSVSGRSRCRACVLRCSSCW